MRRLLAIYKREMAGYFVSPIAYFVVGFFLLVSGVFFYFGILVPILDQASNPQRFGPQGIDVTGRVISEFIGLAGTLTLFLAPFLTMGVFAEERRRGTMELLMTSPITELQIVVAKFFAALTLFIAMITPTLVFHAYVAIYSDPGPSWRVMWVGYLGLVLLGAVLVALGCFISSITESQIIAGVATFALFLLLWVLHLMARGS